MADPRTSLVLLIKRIEGVIDRPLPQDLTDDIEAERASKGLLHLEMALDHAKRALASNDESVIGAAALECLALERESRALERNIEQTRSKRAQRTLVYIIKEKTRRSAAKQKQEDYQRWKAGKKTGGHQTEAAWQRWQPHIREFKRLLDANVDQAKARAQIAKKLDVSDRAVRKWLTCANVKKLERS